MDLGRARITEFRLKYGEKADALINAIRLAYKSNENKEAGDFNYKQVLEALERLGYGFDPRNLLRVMEKEYGLIETSFRTSNQHWWKVKVNGLLDDSEDLELSNPKVVAIRIKASSLGLQEIKRKLEFMLRKSVITEIDKREFRRFSFSELDFLVALLEEASQYEETQDIAEEVMNILVLSYQVARRIGGQTNRKGLPEAKGEKENSHDNGVRLPDLESDF